MEITKEELEKVIDSLSKPLLWIAYIMISVMGRVSYEYMKGNKMSWGQIFAMFGCAIFVGTLSFFVCDKHFPQYTAVVCPVVTLASKEIMHAIVSMDYRKLYADVMQGLADRAKKED